MTLMLINHINRLTKGRGKWFWFAHRLHNRIDV